MGMFGDLMNKIFRRSANAERPPDAAPPRPAGGAGGPPRPSSMSPASAQSQVDVAASLDEMAASNPEKLDWKHSIVDLMKLVGMDSSLTARKELADELGYKGDKSDSASMNMWLHKEVMRKLSENGGKVPADLLD